MKKLWYLYLFLISSVAALDVLITQAQNYQSHLAVYAQSEQALAAVQMLHDHLQLSGKIALHQQEELNPSWQDYRQKGYDYLLQLSCDLSQKTITAKLHSPWQSKGAPSAPEGPLRLSKTFDYQSEKDLRNIAAQLSDELIEILLGQKGFASYPIAYVKTQPQRYQICISDLYNQDEEVLYETSDPIAALSWSPDARSLAFVELEHHTAVLKTLQCCTRKTHIVAKNPYIASPLYSPDQKYLYFIAIVNNKPQIFQYHLVTGETLLISTDHAWILDLQKGSDPYHLLVSSERSGIYQIYDFDIRTKNFKRLTFHQYPCISGILNPERQSLFFCELADKKSFMVERSFIESRSRYVTLIGEAEEMSFAPYSDLIAYERSYEGENHIVIKSLKTGQEYVWDRHCDNARYTKPCWAPQPREISQN